MGLFDILQQVVSASGALNADHANRHFDDVVNEAPADIFQQGVAETLRSDQTPPFGDLVGQMFGNASPQNRADMLNQILASLGPAVLAGMAGAAGGSALDKLRGGGQAGADAGGGLGGLGGLGGGLGAILGSLGGALGGNAPAGSGNPGGGLGGLGGGLGGVLPQITPEQASQLSPEEVGQIAAEAQKRDPSIIDALSGFYAQHPELVKTLGGAVLAFAMAKIHERMRG